MKRVPNARIQRSWSSVSSQRGSAGLLVMASLLSLPAVGAPTLVSIVSDGWHAAPPVPWVDGHDGRPAIIRFSRNEGVPDGVMTLDDGVAVSDRARFADGTIDFDEKPIGYDDAGIVFRREGNVAGEFVYLRAILTVPPLSTASSTPRSFEAGWTGISIPITRAQRRSRQPAGTT